MRIIDISPIQNYENDKNYCISAEYLENKYRIISNSESVITVLKRDVNPFIKILDTDLKNNSDFLTSIYVLQSDCNDELLKKINNEGYEVVVDTSLYVELQSKGKRLDVEDGYLIVIEKTKSLFVFSNSKKEAYILNSDQGLLSRDLGRFLKGIISIKCEQQGYIMLHASGIVLENGDTVLFLADSRNGKTSILLEALTKFNAKMLSCDTSILKIEGQQIIARGWPSNFSVSIGTMHDYPVLFDFIPQDKRNITYNHAWDIFDKYVLKTAQVIDGLKSEIITQNPIKALVCLNFSPDSIT